MTDAPAKPNDTDEVCPNDVPFSFKDINQVVDTFYRRVAEDSLLKVPFSSVQDWPEHIERMTQFWWLRFGGEPYRFTYYNPVRKHYFAGFNQEFLTRWLSLFHQVIEEQLTKPQGQIWKSMSENMGRGLSIRNEAMKAEYGPPDQKKSES